MVLYSLADVYMEVGGVAVQVRAAVSDTLPVSVLLGTDIPELGRLLRENPSSLHTPGVGEALVVTRTQARVREKVEARQMREEELSEVQPCPKHDNRESQPDTTPSDSGSLPKEEIWTSDLADDLVEGQPIRPRLSRKDKRRAT